MKNYIITAMVEIEVEAEDERNAIMKAENSCDAISFKKISIECFDDED